MKGDFSRFRFDKEKHYSRVLWQQGRVTLDADLNEQMAIEAYYERASLSDIIGKSGTFLNDKGFTITPNGNSYTIGKGRYYVDGILCENDKDIDAREQPDLVDFAGKSLVPYEEQIYIIYLDVWERHITSLDDPEIQESALGGADTTTRTKVVWQVKSLRVADINDSVNCEQEFNEWNIETAKSTGKIQARAEPVQKSTDPCILPPQAGYRRLENQLYRVEIHDPGILGQATFKWSRDNGIIVAKLISISGDELTVSSIGKDSYLRFEPGKWVEITDDRHEWWGIPGTLAKIKEVKDKDNKLVLETTLNIDFKPEFNPKVRLWDTPNGVMEVEIPADKEGYIELEDGVQIKFSAGNYKTGDYWLIPARTIKGDIEWPNETINNQSVPKALPPLGIEHHFCRLALVKYEDNNITLISDCRKFFPHITDLASLYYVGGDGQEGLPNSLLPFPLEVGVAVGKTPIKGVKVRFSIEEGGGRIAVAKNRPSDDAIPDIRPIPDIPDIGVSSEVVETNADGRASCRWTLGASGPQRVKAIMVDDNGNEVGLAVYFTASISKVGTSPTTGIITFKQLQRGIFGPFYHCLNVNVPPAIILGIVSDNNDIPFFEDYSLYGFDDINRLQFLQFKAIDVNTKTFRIRLENVDLDTDEITTPLRLRWWAIPAEETKECKEQVARVQPKIEFGHDVVTLGGETFVVVTDPNISATAKVSIILESINVDNIVMDKQRLLLLETGHDTGIFQESIAIGKNAIVIRGKSIEFKGLVPNNLLRATYSYKIGNEEFTIEDSILIVAKGNTSIRSDIIRKVGDNITVTIYDPSVTANVIPVSVVNTRTRDTLNLTATMTEPGVFSTSINTSKAITDTATNTLKAAPGDKIEFSYVKDNMTMVTTTTISE